jgi:hypothetical protein
MNFGSKSHFKIPNQLKWRKRHWAALEFALKRGDLTSIAGGWAWEKADHSTSKEIDDIIAKH